MIDDCTALILAGGDSRRMGRDKAVLRLGGQSLLQRTINLMQTLFPVVLLSVRQPRGGLDASITQVCDGISSAGPLAGLYAGLRRATTPWVFAVATDMPYLRAETILQLAARRGAHQAVVPIAAGHPQALAAFYAVSALPAFQAALDGAENRSLQAALAALDVCRVDERSLCDADANPQSFIDLDTPEDFARARRYFGRYTPQGE
ncbi:MAG: molybdenum cofactor guanylyltransferase [Azoarcus sp.]|jgi:molybdopterin-guanine dinucleotide biosynthesis protein A|nr:molybdenum cofactor guanylyltransferase [Azoarcus sp.]